MVPYQQWLISMVNIVRMVKFHEQDIVISDNIFSSAHPHAQPWKLSALKNMSRMDWVSSNFSWRKCVVARESAHVGHSNIWLVYRIWIYIYISHIIPLDPTSPSSCSAPGFAAHGVESYIYRHINIYIYINSHFCILISRISNFWLPTLLCLKTHSYVVKLSKGFQNRNHDF